MTRLTRAAIVLVFASPTLVAVAFNERARRADRPQEDAER